mmetsp:Transcript_20876/g.50534  ORF Transcript_20876/g.50534 Transcript_20876/m.50534 type:complete len:323 (+) Transcript_20876:371-1339(+)
MCRTREIRHLPQLEHPTSPSHHPHRPQLPNVPQIRGQVVQRTRQQLIMGLRPGALGSLATEVRRDLPEGTVQVNGGEGLPAVLEGALGDVFQAFSHTYPRAIEHWRQLEPPVCARHSKHLQRFEETSLRLFQATVQEQQMPVLLQVSPVGLPVLQGQAPEHAVRFIEEAPDIAKIFLRGVPGQLDGQLRTAAGIPGADRLHQTSGFSQRVQLHTLRTCVARHIACGGAPQHSNQQILQGGLIPPGHFHRLAQDVVGLQILLIQPGQHGFRALDVNYGRRPGGRILQCVVDDTLCHAQQPIHLFPVFIFRLRRGVQEKSILQN